MQTIIGLFPTTLMSFHDLFLFQHIFLSFFQPKLSSYSAHINVESAMSLTAAKYIMKYTHKRPDCATLELRQCNEVSNFKDSRYIAAYEAAWHLLEFPIHH